MQDIDATSFTIVTVGDQTSTTTSGQLISGVFSMSSSLPISAGNPQTINFQYALAPNGTSINLSVNDDSDVLTCGLGLASNSSFSATRQ